jgi:hypothetical protein
MTTLSCDLREFYPDKTPKLDPGRIKQIRIMVQRTDSASLVVFRLVANGAADEWVRPAGRIDVPDMVNEKPKAGRRVRYQLSSDANNQIYCALYLPPDWKRGKRYPVIAEYPGNIFFVARACWSTGRPEQCAMGYGFSSGMSTPRPVTTLRRQVTVSSSITAWVIASGWKFTIHCSDSARPGARTR